MSWSNEHARGSAPNFVSTLNKRLPNNYMYILTIIVLKFADWTVISVPDLDNIKSIRIWKFLRPCEFWWGLQAKASFPYLFIHLKSTTQGAEGHLYCPIHKNTQIYTMSLCWAIIGDNCTPWVSMRVERHYCQIRTTLSAGAIVLRPLRSLFAATLRSSTPVSCAERTDRRSGRRLASRKVAEVSHITTEPTDGR